MGGANNIYASRFAEGLSLRVWGSSGTINEN